MVPKPVLAMFFTGLGVWLPDVLWAVSRGFIEGWDDPKFGAYGGIAFAAVFGGMVAVPAGLAALLVYTIRERISEALSARAKFLVPLATGLALDPVKHFLETSGFPIHLPAWLSGIPFLLAVWCLSSALASLLALTIYGNFAANPPLNQDAPPNGGAPVS